MSTRLLAVAWAMPPLVYPRAIQVARTIKGLARRGWEIDVVTAEIAVEPPKRRDEAFAALYERFYARHAVRLNDAMAVSTRIQPRPWAERWWRRLSPGYDLAALAWRRRAQGRALALVAERRPAAVVTFAQPWASHLVGLGLKRRHPGLPWIAHFSDPWVDSPYYAGADPRALQRWARDERSVVAAADAVVFVTERTAETVMAKYPAAWQAKVRIIPHCCDAELLAAVRPRPRADGSAPLLLHAGNLYSDLRSPAPLLRALAELRSACPDAPAPQLEFIGEAMRGCEALVAELGLGAAVRFAGRRRYLDTLARAAAADVLVIIDTADTGALFLPSKVFDYLVLGRPILAITPAGSPTAEVLRPLGHFCAPPDDPAAVGRALRRALAAAARQGPAGRGAVEVPAEHSLEIAAARFESVLAAIGLPGPVGRAIGTAA